MKSLDSFGANDNERIRTLNTYQRQHSGGILEPVVMPNRVVTHSEKIELWSGLTLVSEAGTPAREYSRKPVLKYTGSGSQFLFTGTQSAQGYPGDGSPRDIDLVGIQFEGPSTVDCFPSYDPTTYTANGGGHVTWMARIHNCGFKNFRRVYWGWWDGVSMTGVNHFQGIADTALYVDGAENLLFGGGMSFIDNANWARVPKPHIRTRMKKSRIGDVMPTARGWSYQMAIESGTENLVVDGVAFDSQDAAPVSGASLRISGGKNITLTGCSFKGQADALAEAFEHGIIEIVGLDGDLTIGGNNFLRRGTRAAASTPLIYVGPKVPDGLILVEGNNTDYEGVVLVSRPGQVFCTDPRLKIKVVQ